MTIRRTLIPDDVNAANRGEVLPSDWNAVADQLNALGTSSTLNIDTDGTLAANSDSRIATQKATKTYVDALIPSLDALVYKGVIDCSGSPNYPAADAGHVYKISVAGKIGGASGVVVEVNDMAICTVDGSVSGNQATVGANWDIIQSNIDGAVTGPASATSTAIATFNGTTGKIIQDNSAATIAAGVITASGFVGPLTGNVTGNVTGNAGTVTVADAGADTTTWILLGTSQTGSLAPATDATLTFNASTNTLTTTTVVAALTGNASTATALATARAIGGVNFDGTADIVPTNIQPASEGSDTSCFPLFVNAASGTSQQPKYNASLGYNASTNTLTATTFSGALSGNATTATTATNATNVAVTDSASDTTMWVMLAGSQTGNVPAMSDATLTFNASTNALTTTTFIGALTGNADTATTATTATNVTVVNETTDTTCFPLFVTTATGGQSPKSAASLTFNSNTGVLGATTFSGAGTSLTGTAASLTAGNVTTNANLTGVITSVGNATSIASQTGTGTKFVVDTSPVLVTPNIGTPSAGVLTNCTGLPVAGGGTGLATMTTAYAVICAGTTATGALQPLAALGASGTVLTSNGAGALPSFQTAAGGAYVLLSTATASNSATLDFTSLITSTYSTYIFEFEDIQPATDITQLWMRTSTNNGSSYDAGASDYAWTSYGVVVGATAMSTMQGDAADNQIIVTGAEVAMGNQAAEGVQNGIVILRNPLGTAKQKIVEARLCIQGPTTINNATNVWGARLATADIDAVRFLASSGNITSGKIRMYGVKAT